MTKGQTQAAPKMNILKVRIGPAPTRSGNRYENLDIESVREALQAAYPSTRIDLSAWTGLGNIGRAGEAVITPKLPIGTDYRVGMEIEAAVAKVIDQIAG